ncbi:type I-E CRISPR-associated protein Cas5/CasD [Actinoallomurus liliacearum]|uniref:Type I-E CRISPR-associated protein Cas5/CasD n=1 Tax=Actinoallomurus liliacearum TaxID=1080073 RepID=A0ABP8TJY4_9ACTN
MTASLLMCFDAPMQSWGTVASRFTVRDTALEPTKSGVIGLLAAALGVGRDDDEQVAVLAGLRIGVRVDREGLVESDYHTAQNVPNTSSSNRQTVVTHRYYLADAVFLLGVEGNDRDLLERLDRAVRRPQWPIYFGRKAFVPARPLVKESNAEGVLTGSGLVDQPLEDALRTHPWLEDRHNARRSELTNIEKGRSPELRMVLDCAPSDPDAEVRHDHPVSFANDARRFRPRTVRITSTPLTTEMITAGDPGCS